MKFIFDFDDTIFNTKKFKELIFTSLESSGIERTAAEQAYMKIRATDIPFSLRSFLKEFDRENLYSKLIEQSQELLHTDMVELVKKAGKENSFIVTNGDQEFQLDKIRASGIEDLFQKIYVVPGSKKDAIIEICTTYADDQVIFIDDKLQFIEDLDLEKCKNLKTILYNKLDFLKYLNAAHK